MQLLETFFLMIFGHALADFVLQPEVMGFGKNRNDKVHNQTHSMFPHWIYWMTSHSFIHGGIVYLITGSVLLGIAETFLHWAIDYAKCEGWLSLHQDQGGHVACKLVYLAFV